MSESSATCRAVVALKEENAGFVGNEVEVGNEEERTQKAPTGRLGPLFAFSESSWSLSGCLGVNSPLFRMLPAFRSNPIPQVHPGFYRPIRASADFLGDFSSPKRPIFEQNLVNRGLMGRKPVSVKNCSYMCSLVNGSCGAIHVISNYIAPFYKCQYFMTK